MSLSTGEVSEWLKEQPWKGCVVLVSTAGSNPALSVTQIMSIQILILQRDVKEPRKCFL